MATIFRPSQLTGLRRLLSRLVRTADSRWSQLLSISSGSTAFRPVNARQIDRQRCFEVNSQAVKRARADSNFSEDGGRRFGSKFRGRREAASSLTFWHGDNCFSPEYEIVSRNPTSFSVIRRKRDPVLKRISRLSLKGRPKLIEIRPDREHRTWVERVGEATFTEEASLIALTNILTHAAMEPLLKTRCATLGGQTLLSGSRSTLTPFCDSKTSQKHTCTALHKLAKDERPDAIETFGRNVGAFDSRSCMMDFYPKNLFSQFLHQPLGLGRLVNNLHCHEDQLWKTWQQRNEIVTLRSKLSPLSNSRKLCTPFAKFQKKPYVTSFQNRSKKKFTTILQNNRKFNSSNIKFQNDNFSKKLRLDQHRSTDIDNQSLQNFLAKPQEKDFPTKSSQDKPTENAGSSKNLRLSPINKNLCIFPGKFGELNFPEKSSHDRRGQKKTSTKSLPTPTVTIANKNGHCLVRSNRSTHVLYRKMSTSAKKSGYDYPHYSASDECREQIFSDSCCVVSMQSHTSVGIPVSTGHCLRCSDRCGNVLFRNMCTSSKKPGDSSSPGDNSASNKSGKTSIDSPCGKQLISQETGLTGPNVPLCLTESKDKGVIGPSGPTAKQSDCPSTQPENTACQSQTCEKLQLCKNNINNPLAQDVDPCSIPYDPNKPICDCCAPNVSPPYDMEAIAQRERLLRFLCIFIALPILLVTSFKVFKKRKEELNTPMPPYIDYPYLRIRTKWPGNKFGPLTSNSSRRQYFNFLNGCFTCFDLTEYFRAILDNQLMQSHGSFDTVISQFLMQSFNVSHTNVDKETFK